MTGRLPGDLGLQGGGLQGGGRQRGLVWALLAVVLVPYFVGLGSPPLWDANEPLYAQPPKEALEWEQGDIAAPTSNALPYFAHAPFSTWAILPFYAALGSNELAARLPSAIAAALTILATLLLARRLYGRSAGIAAALVLAATPRYWLFARQLPGDIWLVAFLTGAFAFAIPAVAGIGRAEHRLRDLRIAHILIGVGTLAKGPVIWVLYFGALGLTWLVAKRPVPLRSLRPLRALALIVALGAPWSVYMAMRYPEFLAQHYGWYHGGRMLGGIGKRGLLYYPTVLLGDAQPWLLAVPWAWRRTMREPARFAAWFPWLAALIVVLLFTPSAGKRSVYMLPIYPLLAVGVSPWILHVVASAKTRTTPWVATAGVVAALTVGALLVQVQRVAPELAPEVWGVVGVLGATAIAFAWVARRGRGVEVVGLGLAAILTLQTSIALSFPALARYRPIPQFAARIATEQSIDQPEPAVLYAVPIHSLNFYLGRPTRVARSPEELRAEVAKRGVAYVVTAARYIDVPQESSRRVAGRHLRTHAPELQIEELARAPTLAFNFRRTILGEGRSMRDFVLLRVRSESAPSDGR